MQQLQVVEHSNMRVLTTEQLADAYDSNKKVIMRNFQRNRDRYVSGIHYIVLTGEELKLFKSERQNDANLKYVSVMYLWSEKGALLLAKSLSSERAWQAYQLLVDTYFNSRSQRSLSDADDKMSPPLIEEKINQFERRLIVLEERLQEVTLHSGEQRRLRNAVGERVCQITGNLKGARPALFRSIYSAIRERYNVDSYRDVRQHDLQDALLFVSRLGKNDKIIT